MHCSMHTPLQAPQRHCLHSLPRLRRCHARASDQASCSIERVSSAKDFDRVGEVRAAAFFEVCDPLMAGHAASTCVIA